jgi:hypothetical protein
MVLERYFDRDTRMCLLAKQIFLVPLVATPAPKSISKRMKTLFKNFGFATFLINIKKKKTTLSPIIFLYKI